MSLIPGCGSSPLAPMFFPTFRKGPLCHKLSTLSNIFTIYDKIGFGTDIALLSTATWLECPLISMFSTIPSDHWLHHPKHHHLRASTFFTFDSTLRRLRILVHREFPCLPRLLRRLYAQIFEGQVTIAPPIWHRILNDGGTLGTSDFDPVLYAFRHDSRWLTLSPPMIRQWCRLPLHYLPPTFEHNTTKIFWTHPLDPQAQTVWYRHMLGKVPLQCHLRQWGRTTSTLCHLCHEHNEDLYHLSVGCPIRRHIWNIIITTYLSPSITVDDIYATITCLSIPPKSPSPPRYFGIIGTTLSILWKTHWASLIHKTAFDTDRIINTFIHTITPIVSPQISLKQV